MRELCARFTQRNQRNDASYDRFDWTNIWNVFIIGPIKSIVRLCQRKYNACSDDLYEKRARHFITSPAATVQATWVVWSGSLGRKKGEWINRIFFYLVSLLVWVFLCRIFEGQITKFRFTDNRDIILLNFQDKWHRVVQLACCRCQISKKTHISTICGRVSAIYGTIRI